LRGTAEDRGHVSRIISDQHHIGGFHRHIRACADGDSRSASTSAEAWLTPSPIMATRKPRSRSCLNLEQILRGRPDGIFVAPFEQGEIGPALFAACRMRLEGIVSKHRERPHRVGRCEHWQKVKNRKHPASTP
jgi:hypothetical protein